MDTPAAPLNPNQVFSESRSTLEAIDSETNHNRILILFCRALRLFDHSICEIHNKMVVCGADRVLAKHFDGIVTDPNRREGLSPLCRLFLMLYRCDDDHFQDSIAIVGGVLFPCLLATSYIHGNGENWRKPAIDLIHRLCDVTLDLHDLPWSHQLFDYFQEVVEIEEALIDECPVSLVLSWLVDGMLSRNENNKRFVMNHPTLFNTIINKFANNFRPNCPINFKVGQFSKNLALFRDNRLVMVEISGFMRLLFLFLHDEKMTTRINVFETLALLSLDRTGGTKVFNFLDHKLVDISIKALRQPAVASTALEFLGVLVRHLSAKILLFSCPTLLIEIAEIAIMNESYSLQAAMTVGRLATTMSINAEGGSLLDCILQLCGATDHRVRYEGTRVLFSQCESRPSCGFFVVHVPEAVSKIAALVMDPDTKVRTLAVELIANLADVPLHVIPLARNAELLEALVARASAPDESGGGKAQTSAQIALLHLIRHQKQAQVVSQHLCTFKSLSLSCTSNSTNFGIPEVPTSF